MQTRRRPQVDAFHAHCTRRPQARSPLRLLPRQPTPYALSESVTVEPLAALAGGWNAGASHSSRSASLTGWLASEAVFDPIGSTPRNTQRLPVKLSMFQYFAVHDDKS